MSVSLEVVFAQDQDVMNATSDMNASITTNASIAANASIATNVSTAANVSEPQETRARPLQLSGSVGTEELAQVAGTEALFDSSQINPQEAGTRDVTKLANIAGIFRPNPSVGIGIASVNAAQRWVQITNIGIAPRELTGWSLSSGGDATFTFPAFELEDGASVRVREGMGNSTASDLYTNSTAPLWTGNTISLLDEAGNSVSTFGVPA
ncbi:MAG TPA: lamin tail domain-containing protein [Methanotrichaceae archaeon]|nr:lamin tail domain-containing protein [Methanotrichaceae archaeon]